MYGVPAYNLITGQRDAYVLATPQKETYGLFHHDIASIRRDLRDLRTGTYSSPCSICSGHFITTQSEPKCHHYYRSAYNLDLIRPVKPSITYHHIVHAAPDMRASWDSTSFRNEHNYTCPYRPWTTSRYVP